MGDIIILKERRFETAVFKIGDFKSPLLAIKHYQV
jgi:hypothetical protein